MVTEIYHATRSFPRRRNLGLTSQLRRSAVSVASNIAEGQGRLSKGEFRQFLGPGAGLLIEMETQIVISGKPGISYLQESGRIDGPSRRSKPPSARAHQVPSTESRSHRQETRKPETRNPKLPQVLNYAICMAENGRSRTFLWIVIGGGAFFLFVLAVFTLVYLTLHAGGDNASLRASFGDKIGVVELEGVILDPGTVVQQIKKFGDDDSIKAIILHVNSPGGGVAASEEIYREVKRVRDEKKKRIVASIETVGASGAYYVSSATNKIYADNGSVVGSIGVISEWVNYGDLMRWAQLKPEVLTVGEYKSTGDPSAT